ncbi:NADPH-dependent FMN reductase [Candidatus Viadribacter manganicus]|uniref:NADPH-dependent FMN reductase n=1 Tax=Candidatus Viadribacter manganicus TaxID=1759059 RepID=A0A1B1AMM4_9PROT|nr:NAD(P)H-dependent oxidoreductase [Candidatus Viadribacter manganicus]ANP47828.1 NADPH-dependent FMN reductase [Candidatus Viadribacter manganicus]
MTTKVAVVVGSLRKGSVNRIFAQALAKVARPKLDLQIVEIGELPLYDQDLEGELPAPVIRFKQQIESADAVLFVTPEFNRSFSAALKNAIEWGSRPWGKNSWAGKPAAIVGATLGAVGTAAAQSQLRSVVSATGAALTVQPEIYLNYRDGLIVDGEITDESLRGVLVDWSAKFADWIARLRAPALTF